MSGRRSALILAWLSLGVGLIGIAFTLRQPSHISPLAFWLVLLLGIAALAIGIKAAFRNEGGRPPRAEPAVRTSKRQLLATECQRFSEALAKFLEEQLRQKPRVWPFAGGAQRARLWNEQVSRRYGRDFRSWGLEIFDAAVRLDGVDASSRVFVDAPSPTQMDQLPDLFRDAARSLNRAR